MAVVVWIVAGTALWHFSVLVPDRFYGGLIGALIAANVGAVALGIVASAWPPSLVGHGFEDVIWGALGALGALATSYVMGRRFDPVATRRPE
jgi:hypothetical protein